MASSQRQSEFSRYLSPLLFTLALGLLLLLLTKEAAAANFAERGGSFFILSDSDFSSSAEASVRLEAQSYDAAAYGGVDIAVYRVPNPLKFLKSQKDLHRLDLKGNYQGEGAANAVRFLWDEWYVDSRRAWQRIFSSDARVQAVQVAPALQGPVVVAQVHNYKPVRQYKLLQGFDLIDQFRYPLHHAAAIDPKAEGRLEGSSSEFLTPIEGNVRVPLGKLKPGLYIVEAMLGSYRANTLLFIADTALFSKVSGKQMLVWAANKHQGIAVENAEVIWSDGSGVLKSGKTDEFGLAIFDREVPEKNTLFGMDAEGGVFVAENFYYPSEVNNAKLYMVTDRPLYRPGDKVQIALVGRAVKSASESQALAPEKVRLALRDPAGTELSQTYMELDTIGGSAEFTLPDNAVPGGYSLRFDYQQQPYSATFRVAQYTKPHYDIAIDFTKETSATGEAVEGKVSMHYPDGRPVANAKVELVLRSQRVSMVSGELHYQGQFPVKLNQEELQLDADGSASFRLPEATEPSRYIVRAVGSFNGAYPVMATRERLIGSQVSRYQLLPERLYSNLGESLRVDLNSEWQGTVPAATWKTICLEDRAQQSGKLAADAKSFTVDFAQIGNYEVSVYSAAGEKLGQTQHQVIGNNLSVAPGSISLLFNSEKFSPGQTAEAVLTFPEPVADALLTLEMESVIHSATLKQGGDWLKLSKINDRQWKISLPIKASFRPNVSFSALYVHAGHFAFQNRGLAVAQPEIEFSIKTDKDNYQPGDLVTLDIATAIGKAPVAARISLGAVDEMVYLLQPEIAPEIKDFFYHFHRNSVRTSASLSFYNYDQAWSPRASGGDEMRYSSRSQKMLLRSRRDNQDTAYWNPALTTNAEGKLRVQFTMPDSLTRWRITARGISDAGVVGQKTAYINSSKAAYMQWLSPVNYRQGDQPQLKFAITSEAKGEYQFTAKIGDKLLDSRILNLQKGTQYIALPTEAFAQGNMELELAAGGKSVDKLVTAIALQPVAQQFQASQLLQFSGGQGSAELPLDASDIRLRFINTPDTAFRRAIDQLIDYPYGCVEQTASRLLPLALAYQHLPKTDKAVHEALQTRIEQARLRLLKMSGPGAKFTWWGEAGAGDPLLSAYARLAEVQASKALGLTPRLKQDEQFQQLYAASVDDLPLFTQALTLWMAAQTELPISTLLEGLLASLVTYEGADADGELRPFMMVADDNFSRIQTLVLASRLAKNVKMDFPAALKPELDKSLKLLQERPEPWLRALAIYAGGASSNSDITALVTSLSVEAPTLERSLALLWLQDSWQVTASKDVKLEGDWRSATTATGATEFLLHNPAAVAAGQPAQSLAIKVAGEAVNGTAELSYQSALANSKHLSASIQRKRYELVAANDNNAGYKAVLLKPNSPVSSEKLYLDEMIVASDSLIRYAMLETSLPPGAFVEEQHWGLHIENLEGQASYTDENFEEQKTLPVQPMQQRNLGYGQPIAVIEGEVVLRQVIRFTQSGSFNLPPARLFLMYQPTEMFFENQGQPSVLHVQ